MKVFTFGVMSGLSRCGQRLRPCGLSKSEYYLADNFAYCDLIVSERSEIKKKVTG